jgi:uncharacterized protein
VETLEYDCQTCGACCATKTGGGFVPLTEEEAIHLPRHTIRWNPTGLFLPLIEQPNKTLQCIALAGEPGIKCSCSVYEHRPAQCIELKPGSNECLKYREEMGIK